MRIVTGIDMYKQTVWKYWKKKKYGIIFNPLSLGTARERKSQAWLTLRLLTVFVNATTGYHNNYSLKLSCIKQNYVLAAHNYGQENKRNLRNKIRKGNSKEKCEKK